MVTKSKYLLKIALSFQPLEIATGSSKNRSQVSLTTRNRKDVQQISSPSASFHLHGPELFSTDHHQQQWTATREHVAVLHTHVCWCLYAARSLLSRLSQLPGVPRVPPGAHPNSRRLCESHYSWPCLESRGYPVAERSSIHTPVSQILRQDTGKQRGRAYR